MPKVYYPFKAGTSSPIPYMHEEIATNLEAYDIDIFSVEDDGVINRPNVTESYLPQSEPTWRRAIRYARSSIRKYDILHTGGRAPRHRYVAKLTHLLNPGLSHVHTLRVDVEPDSEVGSYEQRKSLVEMADVVTAVSEHTASTAEEHFGVSPEVIYEGVNPDVFHPDYDYPELLDELCVDPPFALFVGSFQERKNPDAVVRVAEEVPDITFLMVGDGPLYDRVSQSSEEVDNLTLAGRLPKERLPAVYAQAAAFLFPTVREGCANVVLEAMASKVPVVGYRATSMPEVIQQGNTGFLADPGDEEQLVEHVKQVLDDPDPSAIGEQARKHVVENHSFKVLSKQYKSLYDELS